MFPNTQVNPFETDPFSHNTKENGPGNQYAESFAKGLGETKEFNLAEAQENLFNEKEKQGSAAMAETNSPTAEAGEDSVEKTSGFGDNRIAQELNQQVDLNGGVDLEGAIHKIQAQSGLDGLISDRDGIIESGAQTADSIETRNKNSTGGYEDGDRVNHADNGMKKAGSGAFRVSMAYAYAQKAMHDNNPDYLKRAQDYLREATSLAEDAESQARLTDNQKVAKIILETTSQIRSLTTKIEESISKLDEATKKSQEAAPATKTAESPFNIFPGTTTEQKPAETTPTPATPDFASLTDTTDLTSATDAYVAATAAKPVEKSAPIDYSEVYKQIVDTSAPIVNPGAKAAERAENAKKYSKSESFQRTATTEMNPGWGLASGPSPEKMPTASTAQLTPEQRAALQQKTGESQLPKAV